jgi:hypothetical protein
MTIRASERLMKAIATRLIVGRIVSGAIVLQCFSSLKTSGNLYADNKRTRGGPTCMADRSPIYSARTAGQQIGYIEDDKAFDLFGRPCAIYNSETGLLRDPNNETPVGYVSLTNIFVDAFRMAEELFPKTERVLAPQASPEVVNDQGFDAPARWVENGEGEDIDAPRPIAQKPGSQLTEKTDPAVTLSVTSDPVPPEKASVQELASHVANVGPLAGPSQQDEVVGIALSALTDPHRASLSSEQDSRPQGTTEADKLSAPGDPGSDYSSRSMDDTSAAPAAQPDDTCLPIRAPSDYVSAVESAQPDENPGGVGGVPPAVEAFMRLLAGCVSSSTHQPATLPSLTGGGTGPKLSAGYPAQKDVDQVLLADERYAGEPDLLAAGDDLALRAAEEEAAKDELAAEDDAAAEEQTAAEDESSDSITAKPSPILFVAGEAWARPISILRDHTGFESVLRDWRLDDAGNVERESLAQSEFALKAISSINETPRLASSEQDQAARTNVFERDDGTDQKDTQSREHFDSPPPAADVAATLDDSQGEPSGPDLAKAFVEVDLEHAVATDRSDFWLRNSGLAGADPVPTEDFFSVDIERAVRMMRHGLGEATSNSGAAIEAADTDDAARETDMDRALRIVLRELEKRSR